MIDLKKELVPLSILLVALLIVLFNWSSVPDEIPMHYSISSGFDNLKRKEYLLLILVPGYLFFFFVDWYAKKTNDDYQKHATFAYIFRIVVVLIISATTLFFLFNGMQ